MSELVEKVALAIETPISEGAQYCDWYMPDISRAAIEAVFAWLATPSDAANRAGDDRYIYGPAPLWTAMLSQLRKEALG